MASMIPSASSRLLCLRAASRNHNIRALQSPISRSLSVYSPKATRLCGQPLRQPRSLTSVISFHTTSKTNILPAEPQVIQGTVNDPAPTPEPYPTHGSYHWVFERAISAALVPLTIAPFAAGTEHPLIDAVLCGTLLIHSHIGFQSIIIDYVPMKRVPRARKVFWWGLRAATLTVAVGLYGFETNDVGLTEGIKRIWHA